jgi:MFS family permease
MSRWSAALNTGRFAFPSPGVGRYGRLLGVPGIARFFVPAAVARLGVAMTGLALLWTVHGASGSFGQAGAATGAFAVADAAVGPQVARLIDRRGQRRVVSVTAVVFIAAGVALILARSWSVPPWATIGLAGIAGASVPPVGALTAARWRRAVGSTGLLPVAMSLESASNEAAFLIGPVLVTTLGATVAPWSGLILVVSLVGTGMIGLLTAEATEPSPGRSSPGMLVDRRLVNRRFVALFAANLAMGFFFGGIGVTITAFALAHQAAAVAGLITAGGGIASLCAGLAYGVLDNRHPTRVMIAASAIITIGCASLALVPNVPTMFLGYLIVGGCVAVVLIPAALLLQKAVDSEVYTQAMTWMNSASALGIATAAPLVGGLVQRAGWPVGFLTLAALTASLPMTLLIAYPILNATGDAVACDEPRR